MDPEEEARLAAEATAAAETAAAEAAAKAKADADAEAAKVKADKEAKDKPTDKEAALLKDLMKHKRAAEAAAKAEADAKTALKAFEGIDPEKVRAMLDAQEKAELEAAEKRGEYDRIIKQVREEADKNTKTARDEAAASKKEVEAAQRRIDDLVVGSAFAGSRFINDSTVLSGDKARRLFGDHFEIENGKAIGYDKPAGESNRTPLVDANGDNLSFEAAIEKIVKADADFERLAKSTLRTGSGSTSSTTDKKEETSKAKLTGVQLIAANLGKRSLAK